MATVKDWNILAKVSNDNGEYFPDLNPEVGIWNKEEEMFIRNCLDDNTKSVLDVGCGDGRALVWLKEKGFRKLYGIDISKICIGRAKERLGSTAELQVWNYKKGLPYDIKFDRVLLMGNTVIADLKNPVEQLKAIKNILKDDGLLFITCWNGKFFTKKLMESYYGEWSGPKMGKIVMESRVVHLGGIVNKWLVESELRSMVEEAGLNVKSLRRKSLGFLCTVSK